MNTIQILFLGEVKTPSYCRNKENETVKWYKLSYNSRYRVGDMISTTIEQQYTFMCPKILEIYRIQTFIEENGYTLDRNFNFLNDFIDDYCDDLVEIQNE